MLLTCSSLLKIYFSLYRRMVCAVSLLFLASCVSLAQADEEPSNSPAIGTQQAEAEEDELDAHDLSLQEDKLLLDPGKLSMSTSFAYSAREPLNGYVIRSFQGSLSFSYGVTDTVQVGLSLPFGRISHSTSVVTIADNSIGNVELSTSMTLQGETRQNPGLTGSFGISIPTNKDNDFPSLGSSDMGYSMRLTAVRTLPPGYLVGSLSFSRIASVEDSERLSLSGRVGFDINNKLSLSTGLSASVPLQSSAGTLGESMSLTQGLTYVFAEKMSLSAGTSIGLNSASQSLNANVGISRRF